MRYLHLVMSLLFVVFAVVQLNDPDPLHWVLIYASVAVICALTFFKRYFPKICFALATGFLVYSLWFVPGVREWLGQENHAQLFDNVAKMEHSFIEESREFLGLWIAAATTLAYGFYCRRRTASSN